MQKLTVIFYKENIFGKKQNSQKSRSIQDNFLETFQNFRKSMILSITLSSHNWSLRTWETCIIFFLCGFFKNRRILEDIAHKHQENETYLNSRIITYERLDISSAKACDSEVDMSSTIIFKFPWSKITQSFKKESMTKKKNIFSFWPF